MAKSEITKIFSERLEELTERKKDIDYKLSDKQQAEQMGIPYPTFTKYKNNTAECPISTVVKIARYYNVSTDYLLGLQREPTNDANIIAITEYTGLTKKAVEKILELQRPFGRILCKLLEHEKMFYYFTIMRVAFNLKHDIIKKDTHMPTVDDEKKAEQAEKVLENTPYTVAFAFDELLGYEYHLSDTIKKMIDDVFYELEKEGFNNGNHNPPQE